MSIKKKSSPFPKTLFIGASGFIGQGLIRRWPDNIKKNLITPSPSDLDILNSASLEKFISEKQPDVVVNLAANTNLEEAEKDRGNKIGFTWKLNAGAPNVLAGICNKMGIFMVQISTDAVFPGTTEMPGPYSEDTDPPDDPKSLSWYAYTKLLGEKAVLAIHPASAIVRISYPFGNLEAERDYIQRTIRYIKNGYPLFSDQTFTPTYTPDINPALESIIKNKLAGVYHVVSKGSTTPYAFGEKIAEKLKLGRVKKGSVTQYLKNPLAVPRPVLGGLTATLTEYKLKIKLTGWESALENTLQSYKS